MTAHFLKFSWSQLLQNHQRVEWKNLLPSSMIMASSSAHFSYRRLKQDQISLDDEGETKRPWKNSRLRRVRVARKVRVRINPRCKSLLVRKASLLKMVWSKICKRLKESQSNFGDLFAGNYLFTQVTPTPFKYGNHAFLGY